MLRDDMKATIYNAFAALDDQSEDRTLSMYKNWVQKLATQEYADELVVVACALELKIRIVCVPHTPDNVLQKWKISEYQPLGVACGGAPVIHLGNNDVHYMWLATD